MVEGVRYQNLQMEERAVEVAQVLAVEVGVEVVMVTEEVMAPVMVRVLVENMLEARGEQAA